MWIAGKFQGTVENVLILGLAVLAVIALRIAG